MRKCKISWQRRRKRDLRSIVSAVLVCSLTFGFCGCSKATNNTNTIESTQSKEYPKLESQKVDASSTSFKDYANLLFQEDIITSRGLYIQLVQNPNDFGLQAKKLIPTRLTKDEFDHGIEVAKDRLAILQKFDISKLDQNEKIEYELLKEELERQIQEEGCYYYEEPMLPLTGAQISISSNLTLLAERFFENMKANNELKAEKLDDYFSMYEEYGQYLQDIATFEREKIELGMGMSKNHAEEVIASIQKIVDSDAADFTSEIVTQIQQADFFTDEEKVMLSDKAMKLAKEQMIPGFEAIKTELGKITDKTVTFTNFSTTEEGKKYYMALLEKSTSTKETPEQMLTELAEAFQSISSEFTEIHTKNPNILVEISEPKTEWSNDADLIQHLIEQGKKDLPDVDYLFVSKVMPQELNGVYGGLYFPPAIDSTVAEKFIYVGSLYKPGTPQFISTIAHEGALGHLYQHECVSAKGISPLYYKLYYDLTGYLEGWTTYIEEFGYEYAGYTKEQARVLQISRLMDIYIGSYTDIAVNYLGWNEDKVKEEIKKMVPLDDSAILSVIDQAQKTPTLFLSYSMGYIKMTQLKQALDRKNNKTLTPKEFHELYYSVPPATYEILFRELGVK